MPFAIRIARSLNTEASTLLYLGCRRIAVCFFFQAEDGIRDLTVTGVQTCALPIYRLRRDLSLAPAESVARMNDRPMDQPAKQPSARPKQPSKQPAKQASPPEAQRQIGRASCRERV